MFSTLSQVLALPTIPPNSTDGSSSIFKDGKLKSGVYKIQNIQTGTYVDVDIGLREVCCRPAKDLEEGRGLISHIPCSRFVFDDQKWEIKSFAAGYTVQLVRVSMLFREISVVNAC